MRRDEERDAKGQKPVRSRDNPWQILYFGSMFLVFGICMLLMKGHVLVSMARASRSGGGSGGGKHKEADISLIHVFGGASIGVFAGSVYLYYRARRRGA